MAGARKVEDAAALPLTPPEREWAEQLRRFCDRLIGEEEMYTWELDGGLSAYEGLAARIGAEVTRRRRGGA